MSSRIPIAVHVKFSDDCAHAYPVDGQLQTPPPPPAAGACDSRFTLPPSPQLPETAEMRRTASLYWNWAVIGVTNITSRSPSILAGWAASTKEMLTDMLVVTPEQVKEKGAAAASS